MENDKKKYNINQILKDINSQLIYNPDQTLTHEWIEGNTAYEENDLVVYKKVLNICSAELWQINKSIDIKESCIQVYKTKTYECVNKVKFNNKPKDFNINGVSVKSVFYYLDKINWETLSKGVYSRIHNDLHFGNVIVDRNKDIFLIDCKENFDVYKGYGDVYYDLAELYACSHISFNQIANENFQLEQLGSTAFIYEIKTSQVLKKFKDYYITWLRDNKYNINKVRLLAALIYLNMSPLHTSHISKFLFLAGLYQLAKLDNIEFFNK